MGGPIIKPQGSVSWLLFFISKRLLSKGVRLRTAGRALRFSYDSHTDGNPMNFREIFRRPLLIACCETDCDLCRMPQSLCSLKELRKFEWKRCSFVANIFSSQARFGTSMERFSSSLLFIRVVVVLSLDTFLGSSLRFRSGRGSMSLFRCVKNRKKNTTNKRKSERYFRRFNLCLRGLCCSPTSHLLPP